MGRGLTPKQRKRLRKKENREHGRALKLLKAGFEGSIVDEVVTRKVL